MDVTDIFDSLHTQAELRATREYHNPTYEVTELTRGNLGTLIIKEVLLMVFENNS